MFATSLVLGIFIGAAVVFMISTCRLPDSEDGRPEDSVFSWEGEHEFMNIPRPIEKRDVS